MAEEEQSAVVARWIATEAEFPGDRCLHQLVEAEAERTPEAVAVSSGGLTATYAELNARANQLARRLRSLGVGPESVVGISIERTIDMAVGLLGIMKAGAAYLPLDPAYPRERLAYMWKDSGARLLVTLSPTASALQLEGVPVFCLDTERATLQALSSDPLPVLTLPENLAYVIYTSGSTGLPKGVEVSHRSVVNHATAVRRLFGLQASDRVLQFATLNFDAALEEIFPTWLSSGTLVLRPPGALPSTDDFLELIERERITVVDLPTAFWSEWTYALSMAEKRIPAGLRLVIVGGDAAQSSRLAQWRLLAPETTRWMNTYGPTEGTIIATAWEVRAGQGEDIASVPIGRPISNVSVYILDANLQPVPPGVPGELWIGGVGVARGYRKRADLTADRFLPDPFTRTSGTRMYRTGDVARYDEEGVVEFLGRTDHQVKIRGFRVELAEVESALLRHAGVREAVVNARSSPPGEKRLAAFYVPAGDTELTPAALRAYCQAHLPEYMVPAVLVPLATIPRTASGKVDRERLVVPDGLQHVQAPLEQRPLSHAESVLADVWKQVLGTTRVGPQDNFFELGGDSILSIQVVARAARGGLRITPAMLFQHPTLAQLASVAESSAGVPQEEGPMTGPVPLGPIQRWFFRQDLPERHHWNQALMLEVHQPIDQTLMARAVAEVLGHHDALRMRFEQVDGEWLQRCVEAGGEVPFEAVDLSTVPLERLREAIEESALQFQRSLNLSRGPVIRVVYYDCGRGKPGRLLLIVHHLVMDGVSWRIVLEDLQAVYQQLTLGERPWFPMKTTSYRQWVKGVAAYASSPAALAEVEFWAGISAPPPLPRDLPGERNTEESARSVAVSLSAEETALLLQDVPRAYGTEINDVLLAAAAGAVARWAGTSQLFVEMEGHGREDLVPEANLSRTVGWFTSLYPVLLDLRSVTSPGAVLKIVKEQLRAIPRKGAGFLPLLTLSEDAALRERLRMIPAPEISFNYLGQLDAALAEATTFRPARESAGRDRSEKATRSHLIDITGAVAGGRLQVEWTFSTSFHREQTIETLARDFLAALQGLIQHCTSPEAGGYTPSDFSLARLDQRKLDSVLKALGTSKNRNSS
jgi:amino acid adenylation domain-containing protein/non-ribosomal peptide synthase protein (TIGR01720 family)